MTEAAPLVARYLAELGYRDTQSDDDETLHCVGAGSTAVYIKVGSIGDHEIVRLVAPVVEGFEPRTADFAHLLELNSQLDFGKFCFEPDRCWVTLEYELLGATLDVEELGAALDVLRLVADGHDERLKHAFGGRLPHEP